MFWGFYFREMLSFTIGAFRGFFILIYMILGAILVIIGSLMVVRNRDLALLLGHEGHSRHLTRFTNSVSRQNIAIVGALVVAAGFGLIVMR